VINLIGTIALMWLLLWACLTLVFGLLYPGLRGLMLRLHPRHASNLITIFWAGPLLISALASLLLFLPRLEGRLIEPHCHGTCEQHVPLVGVEIVAWLGMAMALVLAGSLLAQFLFRLRSGVRMRRQFDALAKRQQGFRVLKADVPAVFTLGWWHPGVFISRGLQKLCSEQELAIILDHEHAHRVRRDNLRMLAGQIFCLVLPRPWARMVLGDLQLMCEQACDFESARRHGYLSVAETLVHVGRVIKQNLIPDAARGFSGSDLELRVHALLDAEKRRLLPLWLSLFLSVSVMAGILLALDPLHHAAEWLIVMLEHNVIPRLPATSGS
tara:strand:+ start:40765 stop:41745 length:981 start_codon:yes stop_codon:yes gene_type:complete